jgi:hypothetical protein
LTRACARCAGETLLRDATPEHDVSAKRARLWALESVGIFAGCGESSLIEQSHNDGIVEDRWFRVDDLMDGAQKSDSFRGVAR